jgi:hypothetical protein
MNVEIDERGTAWISSSRQRADDLAANEIMHFADDQPLPFINHRFHVTISLKSKVQKNDVKSKRNLNGTRSSIVNILHWEKGKGKHMI